MAGVQGPRDKVVPCGQVIWQFDPAAQVVLCSKVAGWPDKVRDEFSYAGYQSGGSGYTGKVGTCVFAFLMYTGVNSVVTLSGLLGARSLAQ
jgi:hypothetical protein